MHNGMEFDSIVDDVLHLGSGLYLRMCVKLSKKNKDGNRDYFHKEYRYKSKYIDQEYSRTIKRSFDYYLLLEKKKYNDGDVDCYIQIRPMNMIVLKSILTKCGAWLYNNEIFRLRDGKMSLAKKVDMVKVYGFSLDKWLGIEPTIVYYENTNTYDKGIRLYLSSESKFIDITGNNFMALCYTIGNFDLYGTAINLLNYLGRPEEGTNLYTIKDESFINEDLEGAVVSNTNRKINIPPKEPTKKSFFDKLDNI